MLKKFSAIIVISTVFVLSLSPIPLHAAEIFYTLDRVNLRESASTESKILVTAGMGSEIIVERHGPAGWSQVVYDGQSGYMSSEYLGTENELESLIQGTKTSSRTNVELTPWSEAKKIFTIGKVAQVYDIYTGLTYNVKSFSNGKHADVEPVTEKDTAIMKRTFSGVWSWDVRPVLVTINGRTMAASINGMPHGGGVNNSNGMNGQVCIHFLGSSTHNGNASFTKLHQDKAKEAYNLSK